MSLFPFLLVSESDGFDPAAADDEEEEQDSYVPTPVKNKSSKPAAKQAAKPAAAKAKVWIISTPHSVCLCFFSRSMMKVHVFGERLDNDRQADKLLLLPSHVEVVSSSSRQKRDLHTVICIICFVFLALEVQTGVLALDRFVLLFSSPLAQLPKHANSGV